MNLFWKQPHGQSAHMHQSTNQHTHSSCLASVNAALYSLRIRKEQEECLKLLRYGKFRDKRCMLFDPICAIEGALEVHLIKGGSLCCTLVTAAA